VGRAARALEPHRAHLWLSIRVKSRPRVKIRNVFPRPGCGAVGQATRGGMAAALPNSNAAIGAHAARAEAPVALTREEKL